MLNISEILENILLEEKVDSSKVQDAIKEKYRVVINYNSHGENIAMGWRIIEVFAYGLTKGGNPVIRAYQPQGDTASKVPSWKFFRLDRILDWKPTGQYFTQPRPGFNPNGDKTMSMVYDIATFNDDVPDTKSPETASPRRKEPDVYIPDGEKKMRQGFDSLNKQLDKPVYYDKPNIYPPYEPDVYIPDGEKEVRQGLNNMQKQLDNPVKIDDYMNNIKTQDGFKDVDIQKNDNPNQSTGPKKKTEQPLTNNSDEDIFKLDTDKQLDRRREQLNNPQFVNPSVLRDYEKNKNKRNNRNI